MVNRRQFLKTIGAGSCMLAAAPYLAWAQADSSKRFIFVLNRGGWDPLTVFAPMYGKATIDMEAGSLASSAGNIPFVDHATRPAVRGFFQANHQQMLIMQGISVRSLSHDICTQMMLTGSTSDSDSDWATTVADAQANDFTLPHVVLGGPVFAGTRGAVVAGAGLNNQLDQLLHGSMATYMDQQPTAVPPPSMEALLDALMEKRAAQWKAQHSGDAKAQTAADFEESLLRANDLKAQRNTISFSTGQRLQDQASAAIDILSNDIARCVTLSGNGSWDTHQRNQDQGPLFESLFTDLGMLMNRLQSTNSTKGNPLADDTIVVVISEMGRTPKLNGTGGRDHWPYTSAMLLGGGFTGDRVIGAYDDLYYGKGIHPATGELDPKSPILTAESFGATLLALADIDPADILPTATAITGILV